MTHLPPAQQPDPPHQGGQYQGGQYQGGQYQGGQYQAGPPQADQPYGEPPPPPPNNPAGQQYPPPAAYPSDQPYQGQPGAPYQPYQGQPGAPPHQPYQGQPGAPYQPPGAVPGAAPGKGRGKLIGVIASVAGTAVIAVIILVATRLFGGGDDVPQVGDCMTDSIIPSEMEVVGCDSADAVWSVVGHDGTWTEQQFEDATEDDVCTSFPTWENALWLGERTTDASGSGDVVCLARLGGPEVPEDE